MAEKFNIATASKERCLEQRDKMLGLAIKHDDAPGKERAVELALNSAEKAEAAANDGRE